MPALTYYLEGKTFGHWKVISLAKPPATCKNQRFWLCLCGCGVSRVVAQQRLTNGRSKSCGCQSAQLGSEKRTTHGMTKSRVYATWAQMLSRCRDTKRHNANLYSGSGITVCARWQSFENFYADMGEPPTKRHTLDRKNGKRGYSKSNCRWATKREQSANTKSNRRLTFRGRTMILQDWARELNMPVSIISGRLNRSKWSIEKALSTPCKATYKGPYPLY